MKKPKLPKTDSIEALAEFWENHDLTDFEAELEEVGEPFFVRGGNPAQVIPISANEIAKKLL